MSYTCARNQKGTYYDTPSGEMLYSYTFFVSGVFTVTVILSCECLPFTGRPVIESRPLELHRLLL